MKRIVCVFFAALGVLLAVAPARAASDCPAICEDGAKEALAKCRENHKSDPSYCPQDNGKIADECRRICAELEKLSPEELQRRLPQNYQDIIEGK